MNAKKKKWLLIGGCAGAVVLAAVLALTLICNHSWQEATCTRPQTCTKCGRTQGEPLGHEWIEATCTEAKHCMHCGVTDGEPAEHEWVAATCTEPKHCAQCRLTQGSVLPHRWKDATCTEPKTCTVCGAAEGEPLGHAVKEWEVLQEATCAAAGERVGVCERCDKKCSEAIEKLPHTESDWTVVQDYVFRSDGTVTPGREAILCKECGEELETREYTVELTLEQKNAVIHAYEEINYWHCGSQYLAYTILADFDGFPIEDAKLAVAHMDIDWDEQAILFARENVDGSSKAGLMQRLRRNGFNNEQIEKALADVGY